MTTKPLIILIAGPCQAAIFRRWDPEPARGEEAETISAQLPPGENVFSTHVWLNGEGTQRAP